ncbi:hypothetical protein LCGC14_1526120 [marine sediment metagenome]|uniref:Uncharacterized protein n=1 Tax=marine sediment metagenome TaxID=412755 RepID=A0A0F9LY70_9ZZZZ
MNNPSIIFVSSSEDYARFKSLCKDKGLSNARLFSHMLHKFPLGKHMLEFDELPVAKRRGEAVVPIDSKQVRFGLTLREEYINKLDSLCSLYGIKRPLMFKLLLSWYIKDVSLEKAKDAHHFLFGDESI